MVGDAIRTLDEVDRLTEPQLQAMSSDDLAEVRRLMLRSLKRRLAHDLADCLAGRGCSGYNKDQTDHAQGSEDGSC